MKYNIVMTRKEFLNDRTIGELILPDGTKFYTMEDKDRGISESDSVSKIKAIKVAKETAIPYGTYRIMLSYSVKLKRYLALLLDVPDFRGIRIHKGSVPSSSSGCVCIGLSKTGNKLNQIVEAEDLLKAKLDAVNHTQAIYITIKK